MARRSGGGRAEPTYDFATSSRFSVLLVAADRRPGIVIVGAVPGDRHCAGWDLSMLCQRLFDASEA